MPEQTELKTTNGEPARYDSTPAGLQGSLFQEQRTQKNLGAIRSSVSHAQQIRGTMFDVATVNDTPNLF